MTGPDRPRAAPSNRPVPNRNREKKAGPGAAGCNGQVGMVAVVVGSCQCTWVCRCVYT